MRASASNPSESWVTLLQNRLIDKRLRAYTVVNASISGDTTGGGLRRLPRALEIHRPGIVLIELGGNDGLQGKPVMVIRSNLAKMIELAQDERRQRRAGRHGDAAELRLSKYTNGFANAYTDLADDYDTGLIPFFMERRRGGPEAQNAGRPAFTRMPTASQYY